MIFDDYNVAIGKMIMEAIQREHDEDRRRKFQEEWDDYRPREDKRTIREKRREKQRKRDRGWDD